MMEMQSKALIDAFPKVNKSLEEKIESHKNIVKILESINVQNPKIIQLLQKENELITLMNEQIQFINRAYSFFSIIENMISNLNNRDKLNKEIKKIIKELNEEGISLNE